MDFIDMASQILIKDLNEFNYQVELFIKKLRQNKENQKYLNRVKDKNLLHKIKTDESI